MANLPDINVEIIGIDVDVSQPDIAIDVSSTQPIINIESTNPQIVVDSAMASVTVDAVNDVTIDANSPDNIINVDVIGGGGNTAAEKNFQTLPIVINHAGQGQYSIDVGKQFFVLGYTATVAGIRIRGYVDTTYRDFDANRPLSQDPLMNGGVLFELVTEIGTFNFSLAVPVYSQTIMPLLIESVVGGSVNTTVSLFVY